MSRMLRFALVGVGNTVLYYLLYRALLLALPYVGAHLVAWAVAVVFSFFANSLFTFGVRPTRARFLVYPLTTVVGFGFTTFGAVLLVETLGVDERYAPLIVTVAAVPLTFVLTRLVLTTGHPDEAAHPTV